MWLVVAGNRVGSFAAGVIGAGALFAGVAQAQTYPSKPIEVAERNMFEDKWMGSAEFGKYLVKQQVELREFLNNVGLLKQ